MIDLAMVGAGGAAVIAVVSQCDPIDFNRDGLYPDNRDLEDFLWVFGGGDCPTQACSDMDFNNDGLPLDVSDIESFMRVAGGGPCVPITQPPPPVGFTAMPPLQPGAVEIVVSSWRGNDANPGTIQSPVRTTREAWRRIRDRNTGDRVYIESGDYYEQFGPLGIDGGWTRGGPSAAQPLIITAAPWATSRPRFIHNGDVMRIQGAPTRHVWIMGLEFVATRALPGASQADIDNGPKGFAWYAYGGDIFMEDCRIVGFGENVSLQSPSESQDVGPFTFRRCIFVDSFSGAGAHSQGIYASNVSGLYVEECIIDHNGWSEVIPDRPSTMFNHGLYAVSNSSGVLVQRSLVSRNSATGLQLRGHDGSAVYNLVIDNALGITAGHEMQSPGQEWTGSILNNVVVGGRDLAGNLPRGMALGVNYAQGGQMHGNVVQELAGGSRCGFWFPPGPASIHDISGNLAFLGTAVAENWQRPQEPVGYNLYSGQSTGPISLDASVATTGMTRAQWYDAMRNRPLRAWNPEISPERIARNIRNAVGLP